MERLILRRLASYRGFGVRAVQGVPIDVDDETAARLKATGYFDVVGGGPPKSEAEPAPAVAGAEHPGHGPIRTEHVATKRERRKSS